MCQIRPTYPSGCGDPPSVSTATAATAWAWTRAGVWARLGRTLVPGVGVFFFPEGPLGAPEAVAAAAAAAGVQGDKGLLLGAAGDGGLVVLGGVTYQDEVWHKECFVCTGCKTPLAGQPFTSQGDSPYCVKCFSTLYAQKCAGCNTAITGFGDGKYVSFQERQWHQPCFKCSRCSVSLVGAGFFPDRDQILCSDCNSDE
ncbi:unnamed protein product [Arctogadus glacialis]